MDRQNKTDANNSIKSSNPAYNNPTPGIIPVAGIGKPLYIKTSSGESTNKYFTDEQMRELSRTGCFIAMTRFDVNKISENEYDFTNITKSLEAAQKYGMKLMISIQVTSSRIDYNDSNKNHLNYWANLTKKWKAVVTKFKDHPAVAGWNLCDEPLYSVFQKLANIKKAILDIDPSHIVFVNLMPGSTQLDNSDLNGQKETAKFINGQKVIITETLTEISSYDDYLNKFQEIFAPQVWSYDLYPVVENESGNKKPEGYVKYCSLYYRLSKFSQLSKTTQRPFWAYCLTMTTTTYYINPAKTSFTEAPEFGQGIYKGKIHIAYPEPTYAALSLEAFSALCYGAQGIVNWSMYLRNNQYTKVKINGVEREVIHEQYKSAPFNKYGDKTEPINSNVSKVADKIFGYWYVFLNSKLIDVRFVDPDIFKVLPKEAYEEDNKDEEGNENKYINPDEFIKGFESGFANINSVLSDGKGLVISHLKTNGEDFVVVLNASIINTQNIIINFKAKVANMTDAFIMPDFSREISSGKQKITPDTGVIIPPGTTMGTYFDIDIKPGEIAVFKWMK